MKTYEDLKEFYSNNKQNIFFAVAFVLIFFVGFGVGGYVKEGRREKLKPQPNYTTQSTKNAVNNTEIVAAEPQVLAATTTSTSLVDCKVKGNISSTGRKLYHVKGGAFYERTKAEQCFQTPVEAEAAGYAKSSR